MSDRSDTVLHPPPIPVGQAYRVVRQPRGDQTGILLDMVIDPHIRTLLTPILEEVSHSLHAYLLDHQEPGKPPELILESLLAQLASEAEIAEFCTTERSRQDRRRALVRGAGVALLALVEMDREVGEKLRSAMEACPYCKGNSGIVKHPWDGQEIINALHMHGLGYLAKGPAIAPAPDGLLMDHTLRGVDLEP